MSFPIFFDGNVYLSIGTPSFKEKESDSPLPEEVNSDIIPHATVLKQLAIGVQTTKIIKSMKELMISSKESSSPVKERSGLSLSAMKSFVVREKEDRFAYEFGRDEKVMSFIDLLLDPGHISRRKNRPRLETNTNVTNFCKELHGAPPESFVTELAEAVGSLKTLRKMALFWSRVVLELRRLWYEGQHIPGIPQDEIPNLNSCLLHQQLQVINCCISRKRRRASNIESLESVLKQAHDKNDASQSSGDIRSEKLVYARTSSGELVLRLGADKRLENTTLLDTGEPVYTPVMQEGPLLTEDVIKETEEFVLRTGSVGVGCSQLLSDMQAFKAANPGCILEDFIRWHSPPDWTETSTHDQSTESTDGNISPSRGHLSTRMRKEGNLWRELWETAKPVPAVRQSPLYYEDLSVEGILHGFENISPSGFFEQLFLSLLSSGCAIAESRISNNDYVYKLFKESKDYIVITSQTKNWVEKAEDICQVYETVTVMALKPDKVIRLTSKQHDQTNSNEEQKSGSGNLLSFLSCTLDYNYNILLKSPTKKQENSPTTPHGSSPMFSRKLLKPESSPTRKQIGFVEKKLIAQ